MIRTMCCMAALAVGASSALAAPKSFVDDFQTVTTYNHQTFVDACAGTLPDWSLQTALDASTFYERGVRGGGQMRISNWAFDNAFIAGLRIESLFVGWSGVVLACPGEPALAGTTNMPFTHDNLCVYGGVEFSRFQLTQQLVNDTSDGGQFGLDERPGFAGVDDDGNGLTDDDRNCDKGLDGQWGVAGVDDDGNGKTDDPADTYGPLGGNLEACFADDNPVPAAIAGPTREFLARGVDGCPGQCGVDDDGNGLTDMSDIPGIIAVDDDQDGVTDEVGEMQPDQEELGLFDDSDDTFGDLVLVPLVRMQLNTGSFIGLTFQIMNPVAQFAIQDVVAFNLNNLEGADTIGASFFTPNTRYNYALCATGTVYGAQMWVGSDVANVVEVIGPLVNVNHSNKLVDKDIALSTWQINNALFTPVQNARFATNSTFGDRFQILEGDLLPIVPQDRDTDGDVDGLDFTVFASCFNKSGNPPRTLGCTAADASAFDQDNDNDVDGIDFTVFASCFNKSGNPPRPLGCIPDLANPGNVVVPANDLCVNATPVGDGQTLDNITANTSTDWVPTPTGCPADGSVGGDLWYEYTPSCSGSAVTVTASTASSNITTFPTGQVVDDTVVAIFSACPPSLANLLTCADNDTGGGSGRHETTSAVIDTGITPTVIIVVAGEDPSFGDKGQVALDTSCTP